MSDSERDELLQLCRLRLDAFRAQRGEEVFAHRSRHRSPISGSIKYRVLTRARGRCECCGARAVAQQTPHQRALELDHIIPNNQGGSDAISNLQALCFRCNAGKRDTVVGQRKQPNRFPRDPGELPPTAGWLYRLRAGGRRKGAAGERMGSCASPP
ncbi:HNH endonuclease [Synechococcus sp. CBW1004]|nr:HNH endonuclease [Synechococcus sp. CBW1004]